jgi:hypothetical protein
MVGFWIAAHAKIWEDLHRDISAFPPLPASSSSSLFHHRDLLSSRFIIYPLFTTDMNS